MLHVLANPSSQLNKDRGAVQSIGESDMCVARSLLNNEAGTSASDPS